MQIAITGHTSGIGLELYRALQQQYFIMGYSRSTGYDLTQPGCISSIIAATKDYHVLINNAHGTGQQAQLARAWADASSGGRRLIINMSSEIVRYLHQVPSITPDVRDYAQAKQQLINVSQAINQQPAWCRSTVLSIGWVDTGLAEQLTNPHLVQSYDYFKGINALIQPDEVVGAVKFILERSVNVHIPELTLSNWNIC